MKTFQGGVTLPAGVGFVIHHQRRREELLLTTSDNKLQFKSPIRYTVAPRFQRQEGWKGSNSTRIEISVPGNIQGTKNLFRRKGSQKDYEEGSFIDFQIQPKVERRIVVSRRTIGECTCGWRYEISLYPSNGSPCPRTNNLLSPWEIGSPWTGVCVVISQRKILDCKWEFCGASSFEELYWLLENHENHETWKVPKETVYLLPPLKASLQCLVDCS